MAENYETTFHGLHKWYEHSFEKLGWIVLAHSKKHNGKVKCYMDSVDALSMALKQKMESGIEETKKKELAIMAGHVETLKAHIREDFKDVVAPASGGARRKGSKKGSKKA